MKKLKRESGVTQTSLENANKIFQAGYKIESASLKYNMDKGETLLCCDFYKETEEYLKFKKNNPFLTSYVSITPIYERFKHIFKGFNVGYMGEGSRGLVDALKMFHVNVEKIAFDKSIKGKGIKFLK